MAQGGGDPEVVLNPPGQANILQELTRALNRLGTNDRDVKIPTFKGSPGEDPIHHMMKLEDYLDKKGIRENARRIDQCKYSFEGEARHWYEEQNDFANFEAFKTKFLGDFSLHGKTKKALRKAWLSLSFDPTKVKISKFLRQVEHLGRQLEIGEGEWITTLKEAIPKESGWVLHGAHTFQEASLALRTHYREDEVNLETHGSDTGTTANPFAMLKEEKKKVRFSPVIEISENLKELNKGINKVTETNSEMLHAFMSNNSQNRQNKPYKPWIAPPPGNRSPRGNFRGNFRGGFRGNFRGNFNGRDRSSFNNGFSPRFQNMNRGMSRPMKPNRGFRKGPYERQGDRQPYARRKLQFDKSPPKGKGGFKPKSDKDKLRCYYCREIGHIERDCRKKQKDQSKYEDKEQKPRKFGKRLAMLEEEDEYRETQDHFAEIIDSLGMDTENYDNESDTEEEDSMDSLNN